MDSNSVYISALNYSFSSNSFKYCNSWHSENVHAGLLCTWERWDAGSVAGSPGIWIWQNTGSERDSAGTWNSNQKEFMS